MTTRAISLVFLCAAIAAAQEKVSVPLSDPSRPATLKARLISGSITVTAGTGPEVVVESESSSRRGRDFGPNNPPPGMHRIDIGGRGLNIEEDHNVVTISASPAGMNQNVVIQVPMNTSLDLRTVNGRIGVTGLNGDLDVGSTNSSIDLKDVSGAVSASTVNGTVVVNMTRVTPDKPMSFSTLNGRIDVTIPADTKARLRLKTTNGAIYSDFDVKMEPDNSKPIVEDARGQGGKYRIRMDRSNGAYGSINGGGPEYSFQTMNGTILIHKK